MSLAIPTLDAPIVGLYAVTIGGVVSEGVTGVPYDNVTVLSLNTIDSTLVRLKVKWSFPLELAPVTVIIPLASTAPIVKLVLIKEEAYEFPVLRSNVSAPSKRFNVIVVLVLG